ncbi:MAG: hypothetical protein OXG80_07725 [Chloroflexi bacterium]|nr:hypothetical protein [Chloroflexota bacterium]MYC07670.1 hypothetical protein [Chloroflexota bacterium]
MLSKNLKEQSDESHFNSARERIPSGAPIEIGMKKSLDILATVPHERNKLTDIQKRAVQKFFKTIDADAESDKEPVDASVNHDKYIYGRPRA